MIWRELPPTAGLPLQWSDFTGQPADSLENLLADFLAVSRTTITSSGTAALVLAFESLKKVAEPTRTEVIIPGFSCPLVVHAAERAGLKIVLCDTQKDSFDFDFEQLSGLCREQTLCIVPTHLGGIAADADRCKQIAARCGAYVVEDAAQAMGAKLRGKFVGTIGDIGVFSLTVGKGLSIYEGGFLVCENDRLKSALNETISELVHPDTFGERQKIIELVGLWALYNPIGLAVVYGRDLRHWLKRNEHQRAVGDVFEDEIEIHEVAALRKRVGANAFARLRAFLSSNSDRGQARAARLNKSGKVKVLGLTQQQDDFYTFPFLMVLPPTQDATREIMDRLWTTGLGVTKLFYRCLADDQHLRDLTGESSTPNARDFAARSLTITNSPMMTDTDFETVVATISSATG